jgi:sugar lactone lactonase YvrE
MKRLILATALLGLAGLGHGQALPPQAAKAAAKAAEAKAMADDPVAKAIAAIDNPQGAVTIAQGLRAKGDFAREALAWQRAVQLRPHIGRYKLEMAAAYAQLDKKRETYNALLELQTQGYAFDIKDDPRFAKVHGTEVWTYTLQGLDANREPFGEGKVAWTLPRQDLLIESVAWDPSRKQLLVGSAREGKVYLVGKDGKLAPLVSADAQNGMWAVFDLAVDAGRNVLWVASTAVPHYKGYDAKEDLGLAGLFKFDLKTGKFIKKFLSPSIAGQDFFLSTVALGPDGTLYAADGVNNAVYQVRDDQFRRLFHAPRLASIRGLAVSADGKTLYLGDHERGLIGYDLAAGKPFDIPLPKTLALGGVEGVAWYKGDLIVVQNGMEPNRVMRLKLTPDGRAVASVHPLAANKPELTMPTLGTLAGNRFYLIANSQKGNYDRFGLLRDKDKLQATRIYEVDADYRLKSTAGSVPPAAAPAQPPGQ